jgi:hypothetical protein
MLKMWRTSSETGLTLRVSSVIALVCFGQFERGHYGR